MDKFVWVAGWISKFLVIRIDYIARKSKQCKTHEAPQPVPNNGQAAPLFLLQRSPVDNEVPIECDFVSLAWTRMGIGKC